MNTTTQKTPDLETVLREATAVSERIVEIGNKIDGELILDGEKLAIINETGTAVRALETAEVVIFSGLGKDTDYPSSDPRIKPGVLQRIEAELQRGMTPELHEAFTMVLHAIVKARDRIVDCVDPAKTDILD